MRPYAHLALLLAAAFWGFGNVAQKTVLDHIGPMTATSVRCGIAMVAVMPLMCFERTMIRNGAWWSSAVTVAVLFATAISVQQTAYMSSTVTSASFLVSTATVLTPVLAWCLLREPTGAVGVVAALVTVGGVFVMSNGLSGFVIFRWGDAVCLISALFYALWMLALGRHAKLHGSPFTSACLQFCVACALTLPASIAIEEPSLISLADAWHELAVLGLLSTGAAFCLQTIAQRYTTASTAALLVSGESVFGAIGAVAWLGEIPRMDVAVGATMILAAIVSVCLFGAHRHGRREIPS